MGTLTAPRFRVRPGALEHIMRSRNLRTDKQLAAALGVRLDDLRVLIFICADRVKSLALDNHHKNHLLAGEMSPL
ncbi:hypothetical protein ACQX0D_11770, partial [Corynebacterium diphtheriae]